MNTRNQQREMTLNMIRTILVFMMIGCDENKEDTSMICPDDFCPEEEPACDEPGQHPIDIDGDGCADRCAPICAEGYDLVEECLREDLHCIPLDDGSFCEGLGPDECSLEEAMAFPGCNLCMQTGGETELISDCEAVECGAVIDLFEDTPEEDRPECDAFELVCACPLGQTFDPEVGCVEDEACETEIDSDREHECDSDSDCEEDEICILIEGMDCDSDGENCAPWRAGHCEVEVDDQ